MGLGNRLVLASSSSGQTDCKGHALDSIQGHKCKGSSVTAREIGPRKLDRSEREIYYRITRLSPAKP